MLPSGAEMGSGFVALFILVAMIGIAVTIWRVGTARRMARSAGMDVGDATAMTLMTDGGLESTYLASSLRQSPGTSAPAARTPEVRLRQLQDLRDQGLVTEEEYAERRRAILDEL